MTRLVEGVGVGEGLRGCAVGCGVGGVDCGLGGVSWLGAMTGWLAREGCGFNIQGAENVIYAMNLS